MRLRVARRGVRNCGGQVQLRVLLLGLVMLCGFGAIGRKLWLEQVVHHSHWANKMLSRSEVTVRIPSVRGEIRDRNGVVLVSNRASYEVDFYLSDVVRGFRKEHGWVPLTKFKAPVRHMLTEKSEPDIVQIVNTSIIPRLQELDLARDYNAERLQKNFRTASEVPFTYQEEIDFATMAKFAEHNIALPGVEIQQLSDVNDFTFYQPDVEGKSQIELSMEPYLRGTPGVRVLQRNVHGIIEEEIRRIAPKPGNNVCLTLDAGSVFKIVTALAGMQKKVWLSRFNCPGGIQYGDHYFHCWISDKHRTHGTLGLADGLKVSCDCFFYQYANAAGITAVNHIGDLFGLGKSYEIGLSDEQEGCMPGPDWMRLRARQERWTSAHTANVSIGQGYVLTSPLQMAVAYAAVANGGIVYEPRLVKSVRTPEGNLLLNEEGHSVVPDRPKIRADLRDEITAEQIEVVRHGLWKVVNESGGPGGGGTGGRARMEEVTVAGKTGTAQATDLGKKDYVAWFCSFAPYEHPRYVIVTMVQSGAHGGSVAAPIAAHILEQCLAQEQGRFRVAMKPLAPARNPYPFRAIEALDFKKTAAMTQFAAEDSADQKQPSRSKPQLSRSRGNPDIRLESDPRGGVSQRSLQVKVQAGRGEVFQRFFRPKNPANRSSAPNRPAGH